MTATAGDGEGGSSGPRGVCVFAPSTIVTVTVEAGEHEDEIHFHAGGQGFWVARLLGRLGVPTELCTVFGGEAGRVARALATAEPIEVRGVGQARPNGAWIHDRRGGDRRSVAEAPGPALDRHCEDELVGAAFTAALELGICVLAGPHRPNLISPGHYERLAADLRANGVAVIADLSGEELRAALTGGVELCKVSGEDLAATSGFGEVRDPTAALDQLCRAGADRAVITRGADPLVAVSDEEHVEVVTPSLREVDPRGAGDAFTALVAAARFWGLSWRDAIAWGASAGSLTVMRRGLATADRREIHQLLDRVEIRPLSPEPRAAS